MIESWLYQKIFHDPGEDGKTTDELLLRYVSLTAHSLVARGWIDRFFFLRYNAGGHHLRYRMHLTGAVDCSVVNEYLRHMAASLGTIVYIDLAEYEPEIQKYGGAAGMYLAEREFCSSSRLTLSCIAHTVGRPNLRFIVATCAFSTLLDLSIGCAALRAAVLQNYAAYWHSVACKLSGDLVSRPVLDSSLIVAMRERLTRPDGAIKCMAAIVGSDVYPWLTTLKAEIVELHELAREGRLATTPEHFVSNLAHTLNNRLGLGPFDEVSVAELLANCNDQTGDSF